MIVLMRLKFFKFDETKPSSFFVSLALNHQPTFTIMRKHDFDLLLRKKSSVFAESLFRWKCFFFRSIPANPSAGLKIVVWSCKLQFEMIRINAGLKSRHSKRKWLCWTMASMRFDFFYSEEAKPRPCLMSVVLKLQPTRTE